MRRHVEGPVAANAEIDPRRGNQRLDARFDQARRHRRRGGRDIVGQVLALICVEDGEALQERDRLGVLAGLARTALLILRHEAIGIYDSGAAFALADISAHRQRLAEGQPTLAGEAAFDHGAPEEQNVDTRILTIGGGIFR
jgi:hypothetical protein